MASADILNEESVQKQNIKMGSLIEIKENNENTNDNNNKKNIQNSKPNINSNDNSNNNNDNVKNENDNTNDNGNDNGNKIQKNNEKFLNTTDVKAANI